VSKRVRLALLAAALAVLGGGSWAEGSSGPRVTLPAPTGPSPVGRVEVRLVDRSRTDPLARARRPRELVVHVFYPASGGQGRPVLYRPKALAMLFAREIGVPSAVLAGIPTHARTGVPAAHGRHAVVLLSPGYGVPALVHTLQAEDLASPRVRRRCDGPHVRGSRCLPRWAARPADAGRAPEG
jgi:hypothetical protein